ncbi:MAG: redoxin domain-containing protein [Bacteroidota bacterium]
MSVTKGQAAPDFELVGDDKNTFKLSEQTGDGKVLLLFFPGAFTSVCTNELNQVNNDLDAYTSKNVQVVGISTDSPFVLGEYKQANALNFPLLSDHDAGVSAQYGAKYEAGEFPFGLSRIARRAAFVINEDGHIVYDEVLESAGDLPDFDAIKAAI